MEETLQNVMPAIEILGLLPRDILLYNFAIWSNDEEDYRRHLEAFAKVYRQESGRLPFTIWRDSSSQNFNTSTGDYDPALLGPPPCFPVGRNLTDEDAVRLLPNGHLVSDRKDLQVLVEGGWRNKVALPIIEALGIPIMHTWNQTLPLWWTKNHYNPSCELDDYTCGDCTHSCHPSIYQMWLYHLYEVLLQNQQRMASHFDNSRAPQEDATA
eukprot:jgi/Botrbrau1/13346/Bobra.0158s0002.1